MLVDDNKKNLTKIEDIVNYIIRSKNDGFYGKIIETYENGRKVHTKIEIAIKDK
ncbi:MAG: hypothetical protein Q8O68_00950 [Candidatus Daviesbacteria bacterium]|nr:hypothetical protein [Candidatus Daviesbacteria bacterium]